MYKKLFFACLIFTSILNSQEPNLLGSLLYIEVEADVETEPVFAGDDAADDMCVLENLINPRMNCICVCYFCCCYDIGDF
jgi:myo-inositol-hexaphosphate 3-phosphohydrolase